jgi:hypothetical protein
MRWFRVLLMLVMKRGVHRTVLKIVQIHVAEVE